MHGFVKNIHFDTFFYIFYIYILLLFKMARKSYLNSFLFISGDEDEQSGQPNQFAGPTGGEFTRFRRKSEYISVQQDRCGANVSALRPFGW